jgi:hypothetical protein
LARDSFPRPEPGAKFGQRAFARKCAAQIADSDVLPTRRLKR